MLKSHALSIYSRSLGKAGLSSTDHLKRVQHIARFGSSLEPSDDTTVLQDTGLLLIQDPVATLV